jgi:hypothetical protein
MVGFVDLSSKVCAKRVTREANASELLMIKIYKKIGRESNFGLGWVMS